MSPTALPSKEYHFSGIDRRRTIRIRRSALLQAQLEQLDRPSIKIAETLDEHCQAFRVLHDVYRDAGYLPLSDPSGLHFSSHHLLPKTCVFIFKTYLTVISTMSYMPDTREFGLPMDELYKDELDRLRDAGRKIVEIGSLATSLQQEGQNLMVFLSKAIFQYALLTKADDLCIMVNPKHARFYKTIFLFESFGEEKYYPKVSAPAVPLRVNMQNIEQNLEFAYSDTGFETDLHSFFMKINSHVIDNKMEKPNVEKDRPLTPEIARYLFATQPEFLQKLSERQRAYLEDIYHLPLYP
jgi:hypothetical protein